MPPPNWKRLRNVRVSDPVWDRAKARAQRDGVPLSVAINDFLINYGDEADSMTSTTKPTTTKRK